MEFGPRALGARSILGDPAFADDAGDDEPEDQVPRELPAVRARACCGSTCTSGSAMRPSEDSPYMLLVAPVLDDRRVPLTRRTQRDAATRSGSRRPRERRRAAGAGGHARRLQRARADGRRAPRPLPALLRRFHARPAARSSSTRASTSRGSRSCDARGGLPHVHAVRDGRARARGLRAAQDASSRSGCRRGARHGARTADDPTSPVGRSSDRRSARSCTERARAMRGPGIAIRSKKAFRGSSCRPTDADDRRDVTDIVKQFYETTPFPELRRHRHAARADRKGARRHCSRGCSTSRFRYGRACSRSAAALAS